MRELTRCGSSRAGQHEWLAQPFVVAPRLDPVRAVGAAAARLELEPLIEYILKVSCPNRPGLVAAISATIRDAGGDIHESQQFDEMETRQFFMRVAFAAPELADPPGFEAELRKLGGTCVLRQANVVRKVAILVSGFTHCLHDLQFRTRLREINMDIVAVISNHALSENELGGLDLECFHHLPITADTKSQQEAAIRRVLEDSGAELVVLARYMQILSDSFSSYLSGRCINIHHSFLPGFKGAKPYQQAWSKGVKMVGATAHFVTRDLDEGPIIAQGVEPISHVHTPDDLVRIGRDIERRVLADAVRAFMEDRIFVNGQKTIVFRR